MQGFVCSRWRLGQVDTREGAGLKQPPGISHISPVGRKSKNKTRRKKKGEKKKQNNQIPHPASHGCIYRFAVIYFPWVVSTGQMIPVRATRYICTIPYLKHDIDCQTHREALFLPWPPQRRPTDPLVNGIRCNHTFLHKNASSSRCPDNFALLAEVPGDLEKRVLLVRLLAGSVCPLFVRIRSTNTMAVQPSCARGGYSRRNILQSVPAGNLLLQYYHRMHKKLEPCFPGHDDVGACSFSS